MWDPPREHRINKAPWKADRLKLETLSLHSKSEVFERLMEHEKGWLCNQEIQSPKVGSISFTGMGACAVEGSGDS